MARHPSTRRAALSRKVIAYSTSHQDNLTNERYMDYTFSDMAVLPTWADAPRRCGIEDADDGAITLAGICDYYIEALFDKFLIGKASPLMDRPAGEKTVFSPSIHPSG
jgi:hypothetical protein